MTTHTRAADSVRPLDQAPPLRQQIHAQLESLITSGALPPGSRLVEGELAQRLGVSRGPVRETLQALSNDGFVDLRPRQGAFVHVPVPKEVDDLFEIRATLECESARLAAMRVTPEATVRLQTCVRHGEDMLAAGQSAAAVNREANAHRRITETADNPLLAQLVDTLSRRSTWYLSLSDPGQRQEIAWHEHVQIIEAVTRGDAAGARTLMAAHIRGARASYRATR